MRKLILAATVAAFGAGVVLPAASIITSDGAYAAQKSGKTAKKKAAKKSKKKTAGTTM
jgi:hypothetical protein